MSDNQSTLMKMLDMIDHKTISELEAERLLNAFARMQSNTPTGVTGQLTKDTSVHGND